MTNILIRSDKNSVTTLSLNDLPANSLSMPMMGEIQNQLTTIDHDDSIRVVIIKSEIIDKDKLIDNFKDNESTKNQNPPPPNQPKSSGFRNNAGE